MVCNAYKTDWSEDDALKEDWCNHGVHNQYLITDPKPSASLVLILTELTEVIGLSSTGIALAVAVVQLL